MAFADWDNLTSITREKVLPQIFDQIGKDQPLLKRFWDAAKLWDKGTSIDVVVKYRHNSQGGSYSGLERLSTNQENTRTRARFSVKQVYQPIVLSNLDLAKNGGSDIASLMETEMEEAKESLKDKFCTQLYSDGTGNSSKDITGLKAAIDDSSVVDTYGGIVRSTYTWFKGNLTTSFGSLTLGKLATMFDSCKSGADRPTVIATTETLWSAYEALLQAQVRFNSNGGAVNADGGLSEISFRTVPVIADEYCPSGEMYFINEKYVKLYYMKHAKHPTDSRGMTMTPLREPVDQDGQVGFILWYGNLVNSNPRRSGRVTGATA
jgi:hypothetical protein